MRARFMGANGFGQCFSQGSTSLRVGAEYSILEIFAQADGANKFRIHFSDVELPSLFDSRLFEITSDQIPRSWRVSVNWGGSLIFGPEEWHRQGFWEAFMDHESWAVQLYEAGRAQSLDDSPR
jgi:hypothetical protein